MPEAHEDDWIDRALKSPETYIDNGDFSRRVMRALPPKRRRLRIPHRKQIIVASTMVGLVSSIPLMPSVTTLPVVASVIVSPWFVTGAVMAFLGAVALVTWWLTARNA